MKLFWHAALMGSISTVAREQIDLFDNVGLMASAGIVGPPHEAERSIRHRCDVIYRNTDLSVYETQTLQSLWEWCQTHDDDAVLYCHTKGVSKPGRARRAWRKLMEHHVVRRWKRNVELLKKHDLIGVNWTTCCHHLPVPCFAGNFWMAKVDWIRKLPPPVEYRETPDPRWVPSMHPHQWSRMHAEMWIGANDGARVQSLACQNAAIYKLPTLLRLLRECRHPEYARKFH